MKVNHIELISSDGEKFCTLGFRDPKSLNPYVMKGIVGLDAAEITPKFYGIGTDSRVKYYNMTLAARDIVLRIGLNPNFIESESFSDLRDMLYRKLVSTRSGEVRVYFKDGPGSEGVRGYTYGFVSKIESPLLQDPEVQITLHCIDPVLRGLTDLYTEEDLVPEGDGSLIVTDDVTTKPHLFNYQMEVTEDCPMVSVHDDAHYDDWEFRIVPGIIGADTGFLAGDLITVIAQTGILTSLTKQVLLQRGGAPFPIADKVQPGSLWPVIFPGDNQFVVETAGDYTWISMQYAPEFWGI